MPRKAKVFIFDDFAGILSETEEGQYVFTYDASYLKNKNSLPVSLTLPLQKESYISNRLFPFFDGLIPEGWLLNLAAKNWKLNIHDRMGLLLNSCSDCIGAAKVIPYENK